MRSLVPRSTGAVTMWRTSGFSFSSISSKSVYREDIPNSSPKLVRSSSFISQIAAMLPRLTKRYALACARARPPHPKNAVLYIELSPLILTIARQQRTRIQNRTKARKPRPTQYNCISNYNFSRSMSMRPSGGSNGRSIIWFVIPL